MPKSVLGVTAKPFIFVRELGESMVLSLILLLLRIFLVPILTKFDDDHLKLVKKCNREKYF